MTIALMGVLVFSTSALRAQEYTAQEIVDSGHKFFGATSGGLATVVEKIFASYGLPNGYLLGEEGSGALIGGLTYGEGTLYTKNAGDHKVFWQGPSLGWDFGGEGSRVMMLVYNLDDVSNLYRNSFSTIKLTKEMFLNHLYGGMDEPELKIIDVFICKLRKKLDAASGGQNYIETVWGRGYVLREPEDIRVSA